MNFDLNEEQQLLAESVRRFLAKDYSFEARRKIVASPEGCSESVWATIAELGLLALPVPVAFGGFGGGATDMMSVMEAMGEALVVEPYLETAGLGAQFVARAGSDALRREVLPAIVEGRLRTAFAHGEEGSRYDLSRIGTAARREGDGYRIDGAKRVVVQGPCADRLVVSARTAGKPGDREGVSLFLVDARAQGVAMKASRTVDGLRAADIAFSAAHVPADALLGREGEGLEVAEEVVDFATALVCAEAVGAIRYANEATLEYLKTRRQFGVAIGSFQALQHRMVDMVISYEQARSMASLACARVDAERNASERKRIVSAAKARIAEACRHVSQESIQLHGGMGMSEELKVSHTFRRLTVIAQQFGDADHHLERFARLS
jgi:alkylation response protein AidB-like acyl-CoA dehydrogenase